MSRSRPPVVDVEQLADQRARFEESFLLSDLARLRSLLAAPAGMNDLSVKARFDFSRRGGLPAAHVEVEAKLSLTCQRCLDALDWQVSTASDLVFAIASDDAEGAEDASEYFETDDGRVALTDVVEEELLLALPLVALHEAPDACGAVAPKARKEEERRIGKGTQQPFAALKNLLSGK